MGITNVFFRILTFFAGASIALFGLSKWLGNLWANRVTEREKLILNKELEEHKSQLDILKRQVSVFNETQFKLYNSLWNSLYDFKKVADDLWKDANIKNLNNTFWYFQLGKETLIELDERKINKNEIEEVIQNTKHLKDKYSDLIFEIAQAFKNQIKGIS